MTIKETHDRILFEVNKDQAGYLRHEDIDAALDRAQIQVFNELLGSRIGYGINHKVHVYLNPFKYYKDDVTTQDDGIYNFTSEFLYVIGLSTSTNKRIQLVSEDELPDILDSTIVAPTINYPYAVLAGQGEPGKTKIQFFPQQKFENLKVRLLTRPTKPNYSYTISGRAVTHSSSNSTNLQWSDKAIEELIIPKALSLIGKHLKDNEQVQYSEAKSQIQ